MPNKLRELLAEYAHDAWSRWMKWVWEKSVHNDDGTITIPKEFVDRWERQMSTIYFDLPEPEKDSDRDEADKMIDIMKGYSISGILNRSFE